MPRDYSQLQTALNAARRGLVSDVHSRFVRALEAEYEATFAAELGAGLSPDAAQARAFECVKSRGAEVLARLRAAGLYPWQEGGVRKPEEAGTHA
jgi:hypothetical protein